MAALRRIITGFGVLALAVIGLAFAAAPDASAHAGGRAQLYIERFTVQPGPTGWVAQVTLIDADSGQPEPGFAVSVSGSGPSGASFESTDLADSTNRGRYSAEVRVSPGRWTMLVKADEVPGGPAAIPVSRRYDLTLTPGRASSPAESATIPATPHHSRSPRVPLLIGVALTAACVVAAVRLTCRGRRSCRPGW